MEQRVLTRVVVEMGLVKLLQNASCLRGAYVFTSFVSITLLSLPYNRRNANASVNALLIKAYTVEQTVCTSEEIPRGMFHLYPASNDVPLETAKFSVLVRGFTVEEVDMVWPGSQSRL